MQKSHLPVNNPGQHSPTMTGDYSRISETARAVELRVWPEIEAYLSDSAAVLAAWPGGRVFTIADYGAADGVNSSRLFSKIIHRLQAINPTLRVKLVYIDLAGADLFYQAWRESPLSRFNNIEAAYIQRSFYDSFPELSGSVNLGFSSTALHWLNTRTVDACFFHHESALQPNQLPPQEIRRFVEKWQSDWRGFFSERSREMAPGSLLYMANLANLGEDQWPASPGYKHLRDIRLELLREGRLTPAESRSIFVPDYFAAPDEMRQLLEEAVISRHFRLESIQNMTVPCAYYSKCYDRLDDPAERLSLAATLSRVVRAWSESSLKAGLAPHNQGLLDEIYSRLKDRFYAHPEGLPYQYCFIKLVRKG